MRLTEQLLTATGAYLASSKISPSRLSTILFNDGKRLGQIVDGKDLTTKTHERAMQWLSDNWPEGTQWPDGVERPVRSDVADFTQPERASA